MPTHVVLFVYLYVVKLLWALEDTLHYKRKEINTADKKIDSRVIFPM